MTQTESTATTGNFVGNPQPAASALARRVVDEWSDRLRRYAASILRNRDAAADAVQDVLVKLIEAPPGGLPAEEPAMRAWLFKAVRRRCIDILRKEGRMSLLEEQPPAAVNMRLVGGENPAETAENHDDTTHALAALDKLPPLQREALRLKFNGELSYKQIAETMGKSVSHVGVLIHEGLRTLRHELSN